MKIIKAKSEEFNRRAVEHEKFDVLLSPEASEKESLRQEDSGFNDVLARLMSSRKISLGIDLTEISALGSISKAKRLAKIIQNIKIARKANTNLAVVGNKKGCFYILLSLGASTQQAKSASYINT